MRILAQPRWGREVFITHYPIIWWRYILFFNWRKYTKGPESEHIIFFTHWLYTSFAHAHRGIIIDSIVKHHYNYYDIWITANTKACCPLTPTSLFNDLTKKHEIKTHKKHLQCERIGRGESTKKHRNKKVEECITPIWYNIIQMHVYNYIKCWSTLY